MAVDQDHDVVTDLLERARTGDEHAFAELVEPHRRESPRFTMPPLPAWFDGAEDVTAFFEHRSLVTPWRVRRRLTVNGRPALLGEQQHDGRWRPGALMVLHVGGGRIQWIASFLDPENWAGRIC